MNKGYSFIATLVGLFVAMAYAQEDVVMNIDALMRTYVAAGNFSGVVLVVKDGKVLYDQAYGLAQHEFDVPNTVDTKFRVASISKQFTAMAILQLQERGLLNVNDCLSHYLTDYPRGNEIILLQLLNQQSGIPDHQSFAEYPVISRVTASLSDVIDAFKDKPLQFKPGARFQYSDSNYILLTAIIEKVSGMTYQEYLRQNIFNRVGMHNSGVERNQDIIKNKASGYGTKDGVLVNAAYLDMSFEQGAGALYSTIHDLYLWDRALYADMVIQQSTFEAVFNNDTVSAQERYLYGWVMDTVFDKRRMWHLGLGGGFTASIQRFIDEDTCIIALSNFNFTPIEEIGNKLAALIFGSVHKT